MTTRKARSSSAQRRRTAKPASSNRMPLVIGGVVLVVVVAAIMALALSGSTPTVSEPAASPVAVSGTPLPDFTATEGDPAVGMTIPSLTSIGLDGQPMTIAPDGRAKAIVILAHWCPHCQAEVPLLVDYLNDTGMPDGVRLVGISTSITPTAANYPPSAWLEREGWTAPTLNDDANSTALHALGIGNFPGFVFVDADGLVVGRMTGEIPMDSFDEIVSSLAP